MSEWTAAAEGFEIFIESEDFTHDVRLYLNGDFSDRIEAFKYAKSIAEKLNSKDGEK